MLEVLDLYKTYYDAGAPVPVLAGLGLEIERGQMVGVVGDSGAGKTTLLYLIGALERPTSGRVLFDGADVFPLGIQDAQLAEFRNRKVGFVFQFHGLIPEFNTLENTMMPALIADLPFDEAARLAAHVLGELGLGERLTHKPGELSGGEQQRVAFGRALVMEPELILADEPTGNLDAATGEHLWDMMFDINQRKGTTFIVVTHNEKLARRMPRLLRLANGKLEPAA
jgi:lipoprotein-releasing system ATP-binding protein